jgi:hypothetical protein
MKFRNFVYNTASQYGASERVIIGLILIPIVCACFSIGLIAHQSTRQFFINVVSENNFVEILTFLLLIYGGVMSFRLSTRCRKTGEKAFVSAFYFTYGIALLLIGMEEIAWGQWLIGFETPEAIREINAQGELTLHNLQAIQGGSVYFYLVFCVGATIGVLLNRYTALASIAAPAIITPYLAVIAVFAFADWYTDYYWAPHGVAFAFDRISEVIEMLIGVVTVIYVSFNSRRLSMKRSDEVGADPANRILPAKLPIELPARRINM